MKDLNLSRMINIAAAGGALLAATGCGPSTAKAASKLCKAMESCDKADFDDEFDSMAECEAYYEDYIQYYEEEYGKECGEKMTEFYLCRAKAYKADCSYDDIEEECLAEAEAFYDACDE